MRAIKQMLLVAHLQHWISGTTCTSTWIDEELRVVCHNQERTGHLLALLCLLKKSVCQSQKQNFITIPCAVRRSMDLIYNHSQWSTANCQYSQPNG